eukprot:2187215-Pleurochrysis_carterae.AAC.1
MPLRIHGKATLTAIHLHTEAQEGESRRHESVLPSKTRAATLKAYKQKMTKANQGASSSTNEDEFDSSLGFPREGPKITFASANIRGSVSDNKFYKS